MQRRAHIHLIIIMCESHMHLSPSVIFEIHHDFNVFFLAAVEGFCIYAFYSCID